MAKAIKNQLPGKTRDRKVSFFMRKIKDEKLPRAIAIEENYSLRRESV
ncbi:hypothetical protein BN1317_70001 [Staphylococcus capitis]|nr:hypothetical protein CR01_100001 [Staphylococcus capitis CR01]CUT96936.1 hypothetical protein BN1317_70001 [Staphylococcus capitis]